MTSRQVALSRVDRTISLVFLQSSVDPYSSVRQNPLARCIAGSCCDFACFFFSLCFSAQKKSLARLCLMRLSIYLLFRDPSALPVRSRVSVVRCRGAIRAQTQPNREVSTGYQTVRGQPHETCKKKKV